MNYHKLAKCPNHIAIIMDGNARWAKKNNKKTISGHDQGVKNIKKIANSCIKFGVKYLTLYAFSTENWQRSQLEIENLFKLLSEYLDNDVDYLSKLDIRLNVIGDLSLVCNKIITKINEIQNKTKDNNTLTLTVALSYGSRQEIKNALLKIVESVISNDININDISEDLISSKMYCNLPEPDLLIRTGYEKRLSNFLLWQIAYTELCFIDQFWPDFNEESLYDCIINYNKRSRRYGKR